jgi:alanyl-tRNA synthetase
VSATERLYYTDCYLTRFRASVRERSADGCRVYLDRTAFYPTSGGQPNDLGSLAGQTVLDVQDEDGRIAHLLAAPVEAVEVEGAVDWPRRYDHMQQHTGQHLLSAVLVELFGFQTVSFHMGSEVSTIELRTGDFTERHAEQAEERANQLVREARPVRIEFESADAVEGLRKPSQRSGTLRIIEIEGIDRSACGGTHVRSTAEVGPIQIRRQEKLRGNVRIEFICGARAVRRVRQDFRIALELARQAAAPIDMLPEHYAALRQRFTEADRERERLVIELAKQEGAALYAETPPGPDGLRRRLLEAPRIDDSVRAKAQAFTAGGRGVFLVIGTEQNSVLLACSADSGLNAGAILKQVLSATGGRGGGSAILAQGTLPGDGITALKNRLCV